MKTKTAIFSQAIWPKAWSFSEGMQIILGSLYIALLSQIEIPLKFVPVTLQTFAIFSLALFQGGRKSCFSLLLYLLEATIGLPVFPVAYSDPFWIFQPTAGYCLSFPLAAYICGKFSESKNSFSMLKMMLGLCCAQFMIYLIGVAWLGFIIGLEQALVFGFYPFVLFDIVKLLAAASVKMASGTSVRLYEACLKKVRIFYERF